MIKRWKEACKFAEYKALKRSLSVSNLYETNWFPRRYRW